MKNTVNDSEEDIKAVTIAAAQIAIVVMRGIPHQVYRKEFVRHVTKQLNQELEMLERES